MRLRSLVRQRSSALALASITVIALSACGSENGAATEDAAAADGELTAVTVGVIPVLSAAPIFLGVQEGFFEEEGLEVTTEIVQNAAAGIPALLNGELQFLESSSVPTINAVAQDTPIVVVGNETRLNDAQAVLIVREDGPQSLADLEGRTVAVNALKAFLQLAVQASIDADGGDSSATQFIELPFSDMIGALQAGRVDAITVAEPLSTVAQQQGMRVLAYPHEALPSDAAAGWQLASRQYAGENAEVVESFQRALARSVEFAADNPEATLAVIPEYTQVDPAVLEQAVFPDYWPEVSTDATAELGAIMVEYGYVDEVPDPAEWILQ